MSSTLVIFARYPHAGPVKTRLAAAVGTRFASKLYAAFLMDLVRRFQVCCDRRLMAFTPDSPESGEFFQHLAAGNFVLWPQPEGDLGERLARCFETHLSDSGSVIVIGSDAPTLPRELIVEATRALSSADCVLGPATDGGYYLVGLRRPCSRIFSDVDWGGPGVLDQTIHRLKSAGLTLHLLPPWYDVDTPDDLMVLRGHLAAQRAAGINPDLPWTARILDESDESSGAGDA